MDRINQICGELWEDMEIAINEAGREIAARLYNDTGLTMRECVERVYGKVDSVSFDGSDMDGGDFTFYFKNDRKVFVKESNDFRIKIL